MMIAIDVTCFFLILFSIDQNDRLFGIAFFQIG